jgi:cellulase/cellobiase CelA1
MRRWKDSWKIDILWRTNVFRGDHSADVAIAVDVDEDYTIGKLCERLLINPDGSVRQTDTIELRVAGHARAMNVATESRSDGMSEETR